MNKEKQAYKYITVDGIDCAGKSTVIDQVRKFVDIQVVKEPIDKYREEIMHPKTTLARRQELFLKSREELNNDITEMLKNGHVVSDSGIIRGLAYGPRNDYKKILDHYLALPNQLDCVFYLEICFDVYINRMGKRIDNGEPLDVLESLESNVFGKRKQGFRRALTDFINMNGNVNIIDADGTNKEAIDIIVDYLKS